MQFSSMVYLIFLGAVTLGYFALPGTRTRTVWLLAASLAFYYSLSPKWTLVLLFVIAAGYVGGHAIERAGEDARRRKRVAGAFIAVVVGILALFKYAGFTSALLASGLALAGAGEFQPLRLALPIGISFWTFQTISYLVDVARALLRAERDVLRYALFVSFFPQVTAGPIARGGQLLPQLAAKHSFSYERMNSALLLLAWGFAKKLLVADPLSVVVGSVYRNPHRFSGMESSLMLGIGSVAFAIQIYCDFSGYTDIVRGSARLFGVELMRNFDRPYFARSVKEFWRRWHMSLMEWLKHYVFIPLGGSRVPKWRRYANILAVFLVSGIWHGAGMTFVVWGLLNGMYQVVGDLTAPLRQRFADALPLSADNPMYRLFQTVVTFLLVTVAWVFFRAESLGDALYIVPRMFLPTFGILTDGSLLRLGLSAEQAIVVAVSTVVVFGVEYLATRTHLLAIVQRQPLPLRWTGYLAVILVIVVFGHYGPAYSAAGFAYFKF